MTAFIASPADPLAESQVFTHCRTHPEDSRVPTYVELKSGLPMTPSGMGVGIGLK